MYKKNFGLKKGYKYALVVGIFQPCKSDFPRIQGHCGDGDLFEPESKKIIGNYNKIPRVIYHFKFK
jgi:hypothetical protein